MSEAGMLNLLREAKDLTEKDKPYREKAMEHLA